MKKRLTFICPVRFGVTLALVYFVLSIVFIGLFLISGLGVGDAIRASGLPTRLMLGLGAYVFPFLCAVVGFLFGAITAVIHNGAAKLHGGIIVVLEDVP